MQIQKALRGPIANQARLRMPLDPCSTNKRTALEVMERCSPSSKRRKSEETISSVGNDSVSQPVDVTNNQPANHHPAATPDPQSQTQQVKSLRDEKLPNDQAENHYPAATPRPRPQLSQANLIRNDHLLSDQASIHLETVASLTTISGNLRTSLQSIEADRDTMRALWEIDRVLRRQDVTNKLAALNDCLSKAEDAIANALITIHGRLL